MTQDYVFFFPRVFFTNQGHVAFFPRYFHMKQNSCCVLSMWLLHEK